MPDSPVGPAVREARTRAGLSQRALAKRAGTSQSVIARIENGDTSPTADTVERLLNAAGYASSLVLVPLPVPDPVIEAYKRDVDRTLLRQNLTRSVEQRWRLLANVAGVGRELRAATRRKRRTR